MIMVAMTFAVKGQKKGADFPNWVVESNLNNPKTVTIKFYNEKQELIYEETLVGKKIRTENKRVQKSLNAVLNQLIANRHQIERNNLVTASLKR